MRVKVRDHVDKCNSTIVFGVINTTSPYVWVRLVHDAHESGYTPDSKTLLNNASKHGEINSNECLYISARSPSRPQLLCPHLETMCTQLRTLRIGSYATVVPTLA